MTILEAFNLFMNPDSHADENRQRLVRLVKGKCSHEHLLATQERLARIEIEANSEENPLIPIRRAIMEEVDISTYEEALVELSQDMRQKIYDKLNKGGTACSKIMSNTLWVDSQVMCGVLRFYSLMNYDDAGEDDWFTYYVKVAHSHAKATVSMLAKSVTGEDIQIEALLYKEWNKLLPQIKESMLRYRPREKVKIATEEIAPSE